MTKSVPPKTNLNGNLNNKVCSVIRSMEKNRALISILLRLEIDPQRHITKGRELMYVSFE